jgi:hypothetical protein
MWHFASVLQVMAPALVIILKPWNCPSHFSEVVNKGNTFSATFFFGFMTA